MLRKGRGFAAVAVSMLALGIGANTAVFSILQGTLLRRLAYREPGRLIDILDESRREARFSKLFASYGDYREYRRHARTLEQVAGTTWAVRQPILTGHGATRAVLALPTTETFFDTLGAAPELGRTFLAADAEGGCTVVLAHGFWAKTFGGDREIAGKTIALDHQECAVAGVMPASFAFYPAAAQMWRAITPDLVPNLDAMPLFLVGRLKPGVSPEAAQAELASLHAALHTGGTEGQLRPAVDGLQDEFTFLAGRNLRTTVWLLMAAVGLVLLVACVNVANLLLGRSLARSRELAVRSALGGGRARLARQLLTEAALLAAMGGACGAGVADAALRYFRAVNPVELPVGAEVALSLPALLFMAGVSMATALLFGLAPAWRLSRVNLNDALKSGGRGGVAGGGRSRAVRVLVAVEMALSVILLAQAVLLMQSVLRMGGERLGFQPERLYTMTVTLPAGRYRTARERARFYERLEQAAAARSGIREAAVGTAAPPFFGGNNALEVLGRPFARDTAVHDTGTAWVSASWFGAYGVALRGGRMFDTHDTAESQAVAVIDEALAREYFGSEDAIGRRIRVVSDRGDAPWLTVVGVAASLKHTTLFQEMSWTESATVFRPLAQQTPEGAVSLALRTAGDGVPVGAEVQRAAAAIDGDAAVGEAQAVEASLARVLAYPRFRAVVFGAFAAFALVLSAVGLHGVLSQLVEQRTQEIGVRMALGARRQDILRLIAWQGGVPVLAGLAAGLGTAMALGRTVTALLYGARMQDPWTLAGVAATLWVAAAAGMAMPARRAAATDPLEALRQE